MIWIKEYLKSLTLTSSKIWKETFLMVVRKSFEQWSVTYTPPYICWDNGFHQTMTDGQFVCKYFMCISLACCKTSQRSISLAVELDLYCLLFYVVSSFTWPFLSLCISLKHVNFIRERSYLLKFEVLTSNTCCIFLSVLLINSVLRWIGCFRVLS